MINSTKNKYKIITYHSNIFDTSQSRINSTNNGSSVIIPHVCNNIDVFGAGFAAAISNRYPIVKENFHLLGNKSKLGYVQYVSASKNKSYGYEIIFANMIAQNKTISNNNPRPLNYEFLVKCMIDVRNYAIKYIDDHDTNIEIHCPKFGSGLAGGNWNFIENLIQDIWGCFSVFVYSYEKKKR